MIKVKKHTRKRKNGATVVRSHSRKGTAAYALKVDVRGGGAKERNSFASKKLSKKDVKKVISNIRDYDTEFGLKRAKSNTHAVRRALMDYTDKFKKSHNRNGYKKK